MLLPLAWRWVFRGVGGQVTISIGDVESISWYLTKKCEKRRVLVVNDSKSE